MNNNATAIMNTTAITPEALLAHWQGHRRLTRRVIEAFPEDAFSAFSVGGMRPFSELAVEMMGMAAPGIHGLVAGEWKDLDELDHHSPIPAAPTRQEVLQRWDKITETIDRLWPKIAPERFQEVEAAFGQYNQPIYATVLYFIDNEIHHRGQGYAYLRALGIEPPPFWDRH